MNLHSSHFIPFPTLRPIAFQVGRRFRKDELSKEQVNALMDIPGLQAPAVTRSERRNKCHATRNRCLTSNNKKLLGAPGGFCAGIPSVLRKGSAFGTSMGGPSPSIRLWCVAVAGQVPNLHGKLIP